jgi:hypothetical protein
MNGRHVGDRHAILTADHTFPSKVSPSKVKDCARIPPAAWRSPDSGSSGQAATA